MLQAKHTPIQSIPWKTDQVQLFIKREDLIHPYVSGNKFWKLCYALQAYQKSNIPAKEKVIITFGGAFSNHITATAYAANQTQIKSIGIIRGEELQDQWQNNPSLAFAHQQQMQLDFVSRENYQDKVKLSETYLEKYPKALILPEGGSDELAVHGIEKMLLHTEDFDYLCTAVGTGGTFAGMLRYAQAHQQCIGVMVAKDEQVLVNIKKWGQCSDPILMQYKDSAYGKLKNEEVEFINWFYQTYKIALDPIYTIKLMRYIGQLIEENYFPIGAKILCFHTGGLQATNGMNQYLNKKNKPLINTITSI